MSDSALSSFRAALATQLRVLGALILRDFTIELGGKGIPLQGMLMRPVVMVGAIYALGKGLASTGYTPQGFPLYIFTITGYLTWLAFAISFTSISIKGSLPLLMIPHLTTLDLIIARMAAQFVSYTLVFLLFAFVGILFETAAMPPDPLGVMLAFWSALLMGTGLGMVAASISRFTNVLTDLYLVIRIGGMIISGVYLMAADTPPYILNWLKWNPMFHAIEWMRQSWWPSYVSPIASPPYVALCLFFLFVIGLSFERATRRWEIA